MKVHITATPEYSKENIDSVVEVLSQVPGELEFKACNPWANDDIIQINEKFVNLTQIEPLTFDELFALGRLYRIGKGFHREDFVVVLTTIPNDREWYSAFSNKNIFVDANGWEYITENDGKYGIAYQVVENIFQSLSGINIEDVDNEPNIHEPAIGCINDMCGLDKGAIILKLRTAHICNSCRMRATANGVNPLIILQIRLLIERIRSGLVNFEQILAQIVPPALIIDREGKITIGGKPIKLEAIQETLFIFYLNHMDGYKFEDMEQKTDELFHIYQILKPLGVELSTITNLCLPSANSRSTFLKVKSTLNKSLIRELGNQISEFYVISRFDQDGYSVYKIKLGENHRTIDDRFKVS